MIPAFLLLAIYGSFSGVTRELLALGTEYRGFNAAQFPHGEALGAGSWIVLGLLILAMLLTYWERRRSAFLLGALALLSGIIPLIVWTVRKSNRHCNRMALAGRRILACWFVSDLVPAQGRIVSEQSWLAHTFR